MKLIFYFLIKSINLYVNLGDVIRNTFLNVNSESPRII